MAIKKAPDEDKIMEIVNKGGKTKQDSIALQKDSHRILLNVPMEFIEKIDEARKKRIGRITRTQWIVEAIAYKLEV
jgi:hypothetical protein